VLYQFLWDSLGESVRGILWVDSYLKQLSMRRKVDEYKPLLGGALEAESKNTNAGGGSGGMSLLDQQQSALLGGMPSQQHIAPLQPLQQQPPQQQQQQVTNRSA
jgi:hypothetical protein